MATLVYDGSFDGWLTAVFEVYEYKYRTAKIVDSTRFQPSAFDNVHTVHANAAKATRVWEGLRQKISRNALGHIYRAFLSEEKDIENLLLQYVQKVFANNKTIESDYADKVILQVVQTAKKVYREKHRMEAFIRFQLLKDRLYYAICQPDFNVLPLIEKHFKNRYADQRWLIYDSRRKYGLYYDLSTVEAVQINFSKEAVANPAIVFDENETLYQELWQQYFRSVNIAARKNMKLHVQHMPKRYWRYLSEKQG